MKNKFFVAGTIAVLGMSLVAPFAGAQATDPANTGAMPLTNTGKLVNIGPAGNANLRGTIASISGLIINVDSWGGTWIVDATSANLIRRFGGKSNISEFMVGDSVDVRGTVSPSASWTIIAKTVRDYSIQERNATFSGTISNVNQQAQTFSFTTNARGVLNVTMDAAVKIYVNGKPAAFSDLADGMRATVHGVWNRKQDGLIAKKILAKSVINIPAPVVTTTSSDVQ